jgi:hypothetical protein
MIERTEAVSRQVDILRSTGELSPAELEAIGIRLQEYAEEASKPRVVRVLLGVGAWCAAVFLMLFVQFILQGKGLLPCGLAWLMLAVGLSRTGKGIFASQMALALTLAGDIGILTGVASAVPGETLAVITILQFFLCLILYPLLSSSVFRFAAPFSVAALAAAWMVEKVVLWPFHLMVAAELILFVTLILRKRRVPAYFPLEKAVALLLPLTLLGFELARMVHQASPLPPLWPSGLLLCGALVVILFHPATGLPVPPGPWKIGLPAACVLLGLFSSPGLPAALLLLILGRARGERYLSVLGWLFLPVFLGFYYDGLDIDLARKAWVIAGSGLLLLGVRRLATFRPGEEK